MTVSEDNDDNQIIELVQRLSTFDVACNQCCVIHDRQTCEEYQVWVTEHLANNQPTPCPAVEATPPAHATPALSSNVEPDPD